MNEGRLAMIVGFISDFLLLFGYVSVSVKYLSVLLTWAFNVNPLLCVILTLFSTLYVIGSICYFARLHPLVIAFEIFSGGLR